MQVYPDPPDLSVHEFEISHIVSGHCTGPVRIEVTNEPPVRVAVHAGILALFLSAEDAMTFGIALQHASIDARVRERDESRF